MPRSEKCFVLKTNAFEIQSIRLLETEEDATALMRFSFKFSSVRSHLANLTYNYARDPFFMVLRRTKK